MKRVHIAVTLVAVFACLRSGFTSQEKGKEPKVYSLLKVTKERLEKGKAAKSDVLAKDYGLIAGMFDKSGKLIVETKKGPNKNKLVDMIRAREPELPMELVAAAWFELRTVGKKGSKQKTISYNELASTIESLVKLTIRSKPANAKAFVRTEDNYVGSTEVKRWVSPGKVWIKLTLDNHKDYEKEIDVPNENHVYTATMVKGTDVADRETNRRQSAAVASCSGS